MKTFLIVDDSRLSRAMISRFVSSYPGWEVVEAADAEEASRVATGLTLTAATIDFNMPGIDGLELAAGLKEFHPKAQFVLLTANVQSAIRDRAAELGVGFLAKPVTEEKIRQLIDGLS